MLGRMIAAGQPKAGTQTPLGATVVVTNDAEWDAAFTQSAAALVGKTIEVRGSNFSGRRISNRDFWAAGGILTIRSADSGAMLPSITLSGTVRGIDFRGVNFQMTGWPNTSSNLFYFDTGTFGKLRFLEGTSFRHGYSPSLAALDTAADLPEYARVANVRTATTSSTTHPLSWQNAAMAEGWIEFFNRGAQTVYVAVGGAGVVATTASLPVAAGSNVRITPLNPTTDTHFAVLAASGTTEVNVRTEIGLGAYLADAFGSSGSANLEDLEIRNCLFRDLGNGVKGINPVSAIIMDCDFDRIYQDVISFTPKPGGFAYILRNLESVSFSRAGIAENLNGDARDPHGDSFQMYGASAGAQTIGPVYYAGNRQRVGNLRTGAGNQGIFVSDNDINPSYENLFFISTMQVGGAPIGIYLGEAGWPVRNVLVYGATVVAWNNAASTTTTFTIVPQPDSSVYAGSVVAPAIVEFEAPFVQKGNLVLATAAAPAAVFPNLAGLQTATNRAQIEAAITTAAEGVGIGAVATAHAIDWTTSDHTQVIRWENVPSGAVWSDLTNQTANTLITLPPRRILNRRPAQSVTVGAGTEWRSLASDGSTQSQSWTTLPGTIQPDQFIQIRRTSGAAQSTVAATATINGFVENVNITSAQPTPLQFLVQPVTGAYFGDIANPPTSVTRVTFRGKFYWPAGTLTNGQMLFAQVSNGCDLSTWNNGFRVGAEDGNQVAVRTTFPTVLPGSLVVDAWLDIVFEVDQTAKTLVLTVNGTSQSLPFEFAGNGFFNTLRRLQFASTAGGSVLAPGVRMADVSVSLNGVLRKAISNTAATANADPWKLGTGLYTSA